MSQTTGTNSDVARAPKRSTATPDNTERLIKTVFLKELTGVPWLVGNRIEGKDSTQQPLRMTRSRVSVIVEGPQGVVEVPDAMIRAILYEK